MLHQDALPERVSIAQERYPILREQLRATLAEFRSHGFAWDDIRVCWSHAINAQIHAELPRPEDFR